MIFIIITAIIIYLVLLAWTWQSLGTIEKRKKIFYMIIGCTVMYGITIVIFQIAKKGIHYPNIKMQDSVKNILVIIFTGINGMVIMPQIGKMIEKIHENEIEKEKIIKKIIIILMLFMVCLLFEGGYMKDIQEGILSIYQVRQ